MNDEMGEVSSTYGDVRNAHTILVGKSEWKNHLGDLGVDGKIILKLILNK
jgi:hypothetical protein